MEVHSYDTSTSMPTQPLRLAVLGANGKTGLQFVKQALKQGHTVTAVVRDAEKMNQVVQHSNLTVTNSTGLSCPENLTPHFQNQDAVISCLGNHVRNPFTKVAFLHDSMRDSILPAMRQAGVKRLVALSAWYADTKSPDIPFFMKWVVMPLMLGNLFDDHYEMEKLVEKERHADDTVNYTLIRLPQLVDTELTEKDVQVVDEGMMYVPGAGAMSRADSARFALSCLGTDRWNNKIPAVGIAKR